MNPRLFAILALTLSMCAVAPATTFTVNRSGNMYGTDTHDIAPGDGVCVDAGGLCSLRAAVEESNALAGADTIDLGSAIYTTETAPLVIATGANLTINGTFASQTTIQGETNYTFAYHPVIQVAASATVTINNVTIRYGQSITGGGVQILGNDNVTIFNSLLSDNRASRTGAQPPADSLGGAIYSLNSSLNLTSVTVRNNHAFPSSGQKASGGGIYAQGGSLSLSYTSVTTNDIYGAASDPPGPVNSGAGVSLSGVGNATVANSSITSNTSSSPRGIRGIGLYVTSTGAGTAVNIASSTIGSNSASAGSNNKGAGITVEGPVSGTVTIDKSTISGNNVSDAYGVAGGLYMESSAASPMNLTMTNSTVSGNYAGWIGGGMVLTNNGSSSTTGRSTMTFQNDTISGNTARQDGGGIYFVKWNSLATPFQLDLSYVTVIGNVANTDATGQEGGGGIFASGDKVTLTSSVVAGNAAYGPTYGFDVRGNFYMQDYNHIGVLNGGASFVNYNTTDTTGSAAIGPLQNNGGPTLTHSPTNFGPLVDAIPYGVNGCGTTYIRDQRNYLRRYVSSCDKGAVEWAYPL